MFIFSTALCMFLGESIVRINSVCKSTEINSTDQIFYSKHCTTNSYMVQTGRMAHNFATMLVRVLC